MPKNWFSIEKTASLESIPKGSKVHIIGVSGVAMAQISVALLERGFVVSGSDQDFYEPMGSFLASSGVVTKKGYDSLNVPTDAALVVIGNAIRYENPEVLQTEKLSLPYTCFPKVLSDLISNKHSIVVSGTHGKSSTTAFIASCLKSLKKDPSYFIGGAVQGFTNALNIGTGEFSVVEGDEYDSAFFAKVPKFHFYKAKTLIVTSIEYDHADIYPSINAINNEFKKLISSLPSDGVVVCNLGGENIRKCINEWRNISSCPIITYGNDEADVKLLKRELDGELQKVSVKSKQFGNFSFSIKLAGEINALNCTASLIALAYRGVSIEELKIVSPEFKGVKRRQEERWKDKSNILIEDFAHHPTAVKETLKGLIERYPDKEFIVAFEPRSNTSRKKIFQDDYGKAFHGASVVVFPTVAMRHNDTADDLIDVKDLADSVVKNGVKAVVGETIDEVLSLMLKNHGEKDRVYVVMSNGAFGGLIDKLLQKLNPKKLVTL